jgi:hypothetical protein
MLSCLEQKITLSPPPQKFCYEWIKDQGNAQSVRPLIRVCLIADLLIFAAMSARAQSTSVGGGTLSWTVNESYGQCGPGYPGPFSYNQYTFGSFSFNNIPLSASAAWIQDNNSTTGCPPPGGQPGYMVLPSSAGYGNSCAITFTPDSAYDGYATLNCSASAITGFINPKYVVVGVMYAPPGQLSDVQYTNTTMVGNTISLSNSFQSGVGYSVTVGGGIGAASVFGGQVKLTATESTDYNQTSSSSSTNTLTQASTVRYTVSGTPTEAPINHDYDYILLWLNPELLVQYTPPNSGNSAIVTWTGYAFDPNDPVSGQPPASGPYISGPDVLEVQVGCLNGHFSCPSLLAWQNNSQTPGSMVASGLLARSWQSSGYTWSPGESAALNFNDVCQILTFDPLSATPSQCPTQNNYTLLASYPSVTSDGRFTKDGYPPNPVQYAIGASNEYYSLMHTDSQTQSQGNSKQIQQAFSLSQSFSSSFADIFSTSTTLKESLALTWTYSTLASLNTTETLQNSLSVTGPPDSPAYPANQPNEFVAYQDNTFGTFVFVPVYQ